MMIIYGVYSCGKGGLSLEELRYEADVSFDQPLSANCSSVLLTSSRTEPARSLVRLSRSLMEFLVYVRALGSVYDCTDIDPPLDRVL